MRRRVFVVAVVAILTGGPAMASSHATGDPTDSEQVARGEAIYAASCASCHGAQLEGQDNWRSVNPDGTFPAPPHDSEGHTWHHSDKMLTRYIALGGQEALKGVPGIKSAMPGFSETLSDQDIRDVLAYIKSQWPEQAREYQRSITENDN